MSGTTGFSFGGSTAPASSFSFGAPSTTPATSTTTFGASTTPSIGGTSGTTSGTTPSFNFGTTAPTAFSTTPSATAPTTTTAASTTSTTPAFSFGTTPSTTAAPSTSASSATTSTFSFGATPSTTATTTTTTPSTTAPSSAGTTSTPAFTFGATPSTTAPSTTAATTSTSATTPSTTSFSFGATPATTTATSTTAAPTTATSATTSATSFSFGSSASTTSSSAGTTPATPSTPATSTQSEAKKIDLTAVLKNKNLEDIINDWSTQLEDHVGTFTKQAHQVAEWDNKIIENGAKIMKIYEHVNKVQVSQKELDQTLELIFTQQQELNGMLDSLEGELDKLMSAQGRQENPADLEREKGYQLAEDLNQQLDQMGVTLRDLIKKINSNQQQTADDDNPIYQIVQILNAHLNSLEWIDQSSTALQLKIAEVDKQLKASKLEHDKITRMRKSNFE